MLSASRFELAREPGSATVTVSFVPADRRGILDADALASLESATDTLRSDPSARVAVLRGARPDLFAAGADLETIARLTPEEAIGLARRGRSALAAWEDLPLTTIALVEGACYGGALDLVLATDLVLALPRARFAHPGVARGIVTGWGGTVRARARLSPAALRELFLEGEPIDAERAAANGLVDALVDSHEEAARLVAALSGEGGDAVRRLKEVSRAVHGLSTRTALVVEEKLYELKTFN